MHLIVCPHPTLDCFATRIEENTHIYLQQAGGKGINVARALKKLDTKAKLITMIGGFNGYHIRKRLTVEGVPHRTLMDATNTREILYIWDKGVWQKHPLLFATEPLLGVPKQTQSHMTTALRPYLKKAKSILFSGSLPPHFSEKTYLEWLHLAHAENPKAPVFVDCRGEFLRPLSVSEIPITCIKINKEEWESWHGHPFSPKQFLIQSQAMPQCETVIVTNQDQPTYACIRGKLITIAPLTLAFDPTHSRHPAPLSVGSGDAFMAGFIWATAHQGLSAEMGIKAGCITAAHHHFQVSLSHKTLRQWLSKIE